VAEMGISFGWWDLIVKRKLGVVWRVSWTLGEEPWGWDISLRKKSLFNYNHMGELQ